MIIGKENITPNDSCDKVTGENGSGVIWPVIQGTSANGIGPYTKDAIIADDAFLGGKRILAIHGCFTYETFGKPHKSGYCFLLRPGFTDAGILGPMANWTWGYCPGADQNFAD
jgi:hypothetical protein